ncbi:MAG: hypothetical protein JSR32_00130 [Proteobacteria bacterium]|nr:hypothetical protein [Pseudomonadota bacterium]
MKSLLIASILLIAGCTSYSIYGDHAQRQLRNQWSANYELCERLAVATLAPEKIREEWSNEVTRRGVDCGLYVATTHTAVNRDMPFVRWSTRWDAPKMTQTLPVPSQLIHAQ